MNNSVSIIGALAWNTFREFVRDKIFYAALLFTVLLILFSIFLANLTIVETRKILLDFGFAATSISGIIIALLTGLNAVSKEIEKKTIYTILAKPISRSQFVLGKFLGCLLVCLSTHLITSVVLYLLIQFMGEPTPSGFLACNYLMFLESALILAVSVLFSSTASSSFLAGSLSIGVFLIGRSDTAILFFLNKNSIIKMRPIMKVFYDIFPSLSRYNIRDIVAYGKEFPSSLISVGTIYFLAYTIFLITLTNLLFQRKDIT